MDWGKVPMTHYPKTPHDACSVFAGSRPQAYSIFCDSANAMLTLALSSAKRSGMHCWRRLACTVEGHPGRPSSRARRLEVGLALQCQKVGRTNRVGWDNLAHCLFYPAVVGGACAGGDKTTSPLKLPALCGQPLEVVVVEASPCCGRLDWRPHPREPAKAWSLDVGTTRPR